MMGQRTLHVLLVEDEPGDAQLMRHAMRKAQQSIILHCVPDGETALDYLDGALPGRDTPRPHLILLDLKMPRLGGLETLQAIKQRPDSKAIPVIVVTTSALEADVSTAYRLGAAGYVPKPPDLNDFIAAVDTLCSYWCGLVRLPEDPA